METTHTLARELASLLTKHAEKQRGNRSYNPNALPLYLQAVHSWEADPLSATEPVRTLAKYFTTNPDDKTDFCLAPVRAFVRSLSK